MASDTQHSASAGTLVDEHAGQRTVPMNLTSENGAPATTDTLVDSGAVPAAAPASPTGNPFAALLGPRPSPGPAALVGTEAGVASVMAGDYPRPEASAVADAERCPQSEDKGRGTTGYIGSQAPGEAKAPNALRAFGSTEIIEEGEGDL